MKSAIERLRELREDHDKSQEDISKVLGLSQQYYSSYERGTHELPLRHFATLADYYGVSADYLLGRCRYDEKKELDTVYLTREYTCGQLLRDVLSLSEHGRSAVAEYVYLQKLREEHEGKAQPKGKQK